MQDEQSINKIDREVKKHIQPLFEVWSVNANLTDIEKRILYLKEFNGVKLNENEQLDMLQEEFGYYYDLRTYQRMWKRIKKKLYKILP